MDKSLQQAMKPAVAFLSAWLADREEYPPDSPSSATQQYVNGLSDTEAEELFIGSIPLLAKALLFSLAQGTDRDPLDVLHRIATDRGTG